MKYLIFIIALTAIPNLISVDITPFKSSQMSFDDYKKRWAEIEKLENEGLLQSAFKKVESLYELALKESNTEQRIKALIYKAKFRQTLEEESELTSFLEFEEELGKIEFPGKQILASYLAEFYQQYYESEAYTIDMRTNLNKDYSVSNLMEWSRQAFLDKIDSLHKLATNDPALKDIALDNFKALVQELNAKGAEFRTSMYDLIAYRAIEFYGNSYFFTNDKFASQSVEALYFTSPQEFVSIDFSTLNSPLSAVLGLYQELISSHLGSGRAQLLDIDLKRIDFVNQQSSLDNKDSLYFNYLETMVREMKNTPEMVRISNELAKFYMNKAPLYSSEQAEYKDYYNKAVSILDKAIQSYPDDYFIADSRNLLMQISQKELTIQMENIWRPDQYGIGLLNYRNVEKMHFRVYKINPNQFINRRYPGTEEMFKQIKKGELMKEWTINIPETGDYQKHRLEFAIDPLPYGTYALLASANDQFKVQSNALGYSLFSISDLSFIQMDQTGNTAILVYNRNTGKPVQNADVLIYEDIYNYNAQKSETNLIGEKKTNAEGLVNFNFSDSRNVYRVELKKGADKLVLSDYFVSNSRYRSKERSNVILMTDRAIYRPGQIAYVKGIVVHYDSKGVPSLIPHAKGRLIFRDVNGKIRYEYDFKANEFGSFNQSFVLPEDGLNGNMTIQTEYQKNRQSKSIRVEEYKRPKFKVELDTPTQAFTLNDSANISGSAKNFNGVNLGGAVVKYTVSRMVYMPWRYSFMSRGLYPNDGSSKIVASGDALTDNEGRFNVQFIANAPLVKKSRYAPAYIFKVQVEVTDDSGETQSGIYDLRLSEKAFFLNTNIPNRIESQKFKTIELSGENLNGGLVPVSGKIRIEKLVEPGKNLVERKWQTPDVFLYDQSVFNKYFPDRPYAEEDLIEKWKVQQVVDELEYNIKGQSNIQLNKELKPGSYKITLIAKDLSNNTDTLVRYVGIDAYKKCDLAYGKHLVVDVNKEVVHPGELFEIQLIAEKGAAPVFYTLEKDGVIISKWLEIKDKKTIEIPVLENDRGGFNIHFFYAQNDEYVLENKFINVPWDNKDLDISFEVFRDELIPGQKEQWSLKIKDVLGNVQKAELLASMYDASLDAFVSHSWNTLRYPVSTSDLRWTNQCYEQQALNFSFQNWHAQGIYSFSNIIYPYLNPFGMYFSRYYANSVLYDDDVSYMAEEASPRSAKQVMRSPGSELADMAGNALEREEESNEIESEKPKPSVRENLNELVFFYPDLYADENGDVRISFTMNEALTSWKFMSFAHTQDLKFGMATREVKTSKDLMVFPNLPRFFRQDDEIYISGKIQNMLDTSTQVSAKLEFFDPITLKDLNEFNKNFEILTASVPANSSTSVSWKVKIDKNAYMPFGVRMIAESDDFSDGEQQVIPIVPNRMMVTESYAFPLKSRENRKFDLAALDNVLNSKTADMFQFTLEITSNPAWYAVQALPYLMEYPFDCTEQVFSRLYANTLASYIANSNPRIKSIFEEWKNSDALLSALSKNQELKSTLLEETPWVRDAASEEEQKKRIALLFDMNKMASEQDKALRKIEQRQLADGGFPWFEGPYSNRYITQYILEGIGHLNALGVDPVMKDRSFVRQAIAYMDNQLIEQYVWLKKHHTDLNTDHLSSIAIHYLYVRSFFTDNINVELKEAYDYYHDQANKYWTNKGLFEQAMIALAKARKGDNNLTTKIAKSIKERSIVHDELGMYWKAKSGYYWYEAPIERQALMIELFELQQDSLAVDQLKTWLLKNKQTNAWKTTKATASAVYALLLSGEDWLDETALVAASIGSAEVDFDATKTEAGTGYVKKRWEGKQVDDSFSTIELTNPNEHIAWGAAYYQYFEDLDKIVDFQETPLTLEKALFKKIPDGTQFKLLPMQNNKMKVGDEVVVRILLKVDRDMEFVHMKDMRASGLEPLNTLSGYKWKSGLGYYESTKDLATHFFFDYLPKGSYVFEYSLRVFHAGDFSNGISTIQCMYAPEFSSHSSGLKVSIEQ